MKIHALTTGTVQVKRSFLFPGQGPRRQLDLFLPGAWADPLPIHCWAIEHDGVLRLVDTGETAVAKNVPFARMEVTREQELPAAMAAAGLAVHDVSEVVITHAHGDHIDGLVHVRGRVLINEVELRFPRLADGAGDASRAAPATPNGVRARALRARRRPIRSVPTEPPAQQRRTYRGRRHARTHARAHLRDLRR